MRAKTFRECYCGKRWGNDGIVVISDFMTMSRERLADNFMAGRDNRYVG